MGGHDLTTADLIWHYPSYGPPQLLCETCTRNSVQIHLFGSNGGGAADLGTLDELERRAHCPFCTLILDIFAGNPRHLPVKVEFRQLWRPDFQVRVISGRMSAEIRLESNFQSLRRSLGLLETPISPRADLASLRTWLSDCEDGGNGHSECTPTPDNPVSSETFASPILLDVKTFRLVMAPNVFLSGSPRYVALSYIWGRCKALETTRDTLNDFMTKGIPKEKIPKTILDAIHVVDAVGEIYLWVDQLCIIQDDEEHKETWFARMYKIYHGAVLTIVSFSRSASEGLQGVSAPRSRGATIFTQWPRLSSLPSRRLIMSHPPTFESILCESLYETRAWTLQERLSSRRLVYFTYLGMFFDCPAATTAEHGLLEEPHWRVPLREDFATPRKPLGPCSAYVWACDSERFESYAGFVEMFTNRGMKYKRDALNACAGIFSEMEKCTAGSYRSHYGLSPKFFDLSLLWVHVVEIGCLPNYPPHPPGPSKRDDENQQSGDVPAGNLAVPLPQRHWLNWLSQASYGLPTRNGIFPSWSWAGWLGQVSYRLSGWIDTLQHETNSYIYSCLGPCQASGASSFILLPGQTFPDRSRRLQFTTQVVNADDFSIRQFKAHWGNQTTRHEFAALSGGRMRDTYTWAYAADLWCKRENRICGTMFDGECGRRQAWFGLFPGSLQFISLFKIHRPTRNINIYERFVMDHLIPESISTDAGRRPPPRLREVSPLCCNSVSKVLIKGIEPIEPEGNEARRIEEAEEFIRDVHSAVHIVMLVEWNGDCAKRVALGHMASFAWENAQPTIAEVRLE